jgi:hypothetical protein
MCDSYNIAPYVEGPLESVTFSGGTFTASFDVDAKWKHILHQCAFLSASGKKVLGVLTGKGDKKSLAVYSVYSTPDTSFERANEAARDWVADMRYQISGAVFKFQWMPVIKATRTSGRTEKRWTEAYGGFYQWPPGSTAGNGPERLATV